MDAILAVVTIAAGEAYQAIHAVTGPTQRAYAERIEAEYVVLDGSEPGSSPHWQKLRLGELLETRERVLYLDADILVRPDAPDLFEEVPAGLLGAFNEAPFTDGRRGSMARAMQDYGRVPWPGTYYNTGVLVLSAAHRGLFVEPLARTDNFAEQGYLNWRIAQLRLPVHDLHYKLNRMVCMDALTGEPRWDSWLLHYAGAPDIGAVPELAAADLARWEADAPGYQYQTRVLVDVQGGLGDQVAAEPAVRYLLEHVYPGDDVRVEPVQSVGEE